MRPCTMAKAEERKVPSVLRRWRLRVPGGGVRECRGGPHSSANALDFRVPVASPFYSTSSTSGTTKPTETPPPFAPPRAPQLLQEPP